MFHTEKNGDADVRPSRKTVGGDAASPFRRDGRRRLTVFSLLLAAALVLGIVERSIPLEMLIPGVRLGIPNVVILLSLNTFPFGSVFTLTLLKCVLLSLVAGTGVSFLMSIAGSLLSLFAMFALKRLAGNRVSMVGVSVTGAVFHNIGQVLMASVILRTAYAAAYLPVLLVSGLVTGLVVGYAARFVMARGVWASLASESPDSGKL